MNGLIRVNWRVHSEMSTDPNAIFSLREEELALTTKKPKKGNEYQERIRSLMQASDQIII